MIVAQTGANQQVSQENKIFTFKIYSFSFENTTKQMLVFFKQDWGKV